MMIIMKDRLQSITLWVLLVLSLFMGMAPTVYTAELWGACATVDSVSDGASFGLSFDYPTKEAAMKRAIAECEKRNHTRNSCKSYHAFSTSLNEYGYDFEGDINLIPLQCAAGVANGRIYGCTYGATPEAAKRGLLKYRVCDRDGCPTMLVECNSY